MRADGVGIEHHDVRGEAFSQEATVVEPSVGRRVVRQEADRLLKGEGLLLPHPMAEDMGLQGAVHDLRHVAPESEKVTTERGWRIISST